MTHKAPSERQPSQVDLDTCAKEPIHLLGNVQGYGCLIATSSDVTVTHVSQNVASILGLDPQGLIGSLFTDHLPRETSHDLRAKLQLLSVGADAARLFGYDVLGDGRLFDISIHVNGQTFVFEFEPKHATKDRDEMSMVQPLLARVKSASSVAEACQQAARSLQALSGFDRVMVYRFAPDHSGEVIAEAAAPGMDPYLGLRYPASDIPEQARALYLRSPLRLIADVDGEVSPILSERSLSDIPLDLSLAVTRAVSPIHLEYLKNMGVSASMSVSILKDGALWGLFACHHRAPRYVDYERRTAIELFAQFFAYELIQKAETEARIEDDATRLLHDRLMLQLSGGADLVGDFEQISDVLSDLVPCDGLCIYSNGGFASKGDAPDKDKFMQLIQILNSTPQDTVYQSDNLTQTDGASAAVPAGVVGLMAVPISRMQGDYIVFFRREAARSVRWAGRPDKAVVKTEDGTRLSPRKSFEAWSEVVRGTCIPWSGATQRVAETLRVRLTEALARRSDDANVEHQKVANKQDLLIAELNHRVRNILNLVQGLVSQSKDSPGDLAQYTKVLDGRIQALARAHDQLTGKNRAPSSLRRLIEVEAQAFLEARDHRLSITGAAPMLEPEGFSTVALVVHELVTNCAKYGAFSTLAGSVAVNLDQLPDGTLRMTWRELNGPAVKPPTQRGFGSTIIENTIPYELKGTVETRYLPSGFEADFTFPQAVVASVEEAPERRENLGDARASAAKPSAVGLAGADVLVLEDNMIIAMEVSDVLSDVGAAHVHMSGRVEDALVELERHPIRFALLDINLGDQTSLPVAQKLAKAGVPFLLATGYGDVEEIIHTYPPCQIIKKPFTTEMLIDAIGKVMGT